MSRVHHPVHYNTGKYEVIDVILDWKLGFCTGNVIKYVARADHKGTPIEDLEKAQQYLSFEIAARKAIAAGTYVKTPLPAVDCSFVTPREPYLPENLYDKLAKAEAAPREGVYMDAELVRVLKDIALCGEAGWQLCAAEHLLLVDALESMGLVTVLADRGLVVITEVGYAEASR
jgi:hypothetical protein